MRLGKRGGTETKQEAKAVPAERQCLVGQSGAVGGRKVMDIETSLG